MLHDAAKNGGDVEELKKLLRAGEDPTTRDDEGNTPLHLAAKGSGHSSEDAAAARDVEACRVLLAAGADPNTRAANGISPLDVAAGAYREDIVDVLMEYGADPNATDGEDGITALHMACIATGDRHIMKMGNNRRVIQRLLQNGADIEARTTKNETPFVFAMKNHMLRNCETLLDEGADIDVRCEKMRTPLLLSASGGTAIQLHWARTLVEMGADFTLVDDDGHDALYHARKQPEWLGQELVSILEHSFVALAARNWRRRGWLVMLKNAKKVGRDYLASGGDGDGDEALAHLVEVTICLNENGVFRSIVGFL